MAKWQPIETAKRDGSVILVANSDWTWVATYKPVYLSGYRPDNPWSNLLLNCSHMEKNRSGVPTHWMLLPKPPRTP